MMEFIIISGIVTTVVLKSNDAIVNKKLKRLGYINKNKKRNSLLKEVINLLPNFIPVFNLVMSFIVVAGGVYLYSNDEKFIEIINKSDNVDRPINLKQSIDYNRNQLENICDEMKMAGATDLEIKQEINSIKSDMKESNCSEYIFDDSKYKELEAMSDTELWLRDIEMDVNLSPKEKKQLLSSYVRDFKNTDINAKPRAVEKTLKLINSRK